MPNVVFLLMPLILTKDIFCDEDGTREFNKNLVCPACKYADQESAFLIGIYFRIVLLIRTSFIICFFFSPLGETNLSAKFDVIRVDLQASEQFKSVSSFSFRC